MTKERRVYFYDFASILFLAMLIYGEATGEGRIGKVGVAWVAMNRAESERREFAYRKRVNLTSVMLKPKAFSCFNPGDPNRDKLIDLVLNPEDSRQRYADECLEVAESVYGGGEPDPTDGALFYVNNRLAGKMKWMKDLEETVVIGNHTFYKYKKGG